MYGSSFCEAGLYIDISLPHLYPRSSFQLFANSSERASLPLGKDREAGVNPALPRNCKRGHCPRPLGTFPGRPSANPDETHPHSQSQETGAIRPLNPFRVKRRIECAFPLLSFWP